jgi:hypothetical protein
LLVSQIYHILSLYFWISEQKCFFVLRDGGT